MIIHCKNTYGDGTVSYVDYEVNDAPIVDEDADETDFVDALSDLGVTVDEEE